MPAGYTSRLSMPVGRLLRVRNGASLSKQHPTGRIGVRRLLGVGPLRVSIVRGPVSDMTYGGEPGIHFVFKFNLRAVLDIQLLGRLSSFE